MKFDSVMIESSQFSGIANKIFKICELHTDGETMENIPPQKFYQFPRCIDYIVSYPWIHDIRH